ncbi:MAG: hypothetical protein FWC78_01680 [Defluviitaleaceae bacterium]|nr:hypothetical protein [Defluviitaleaceae bacterium]
MKHMIWGLLVAGLFLVACNNTMKEQTDDSPEPYCANEQDAVVSEPYEAIQIKQDVIVDRSKDTDVYENTIGENESVWIEPEPDVDVENEPDYFIGENTTSLHFYSLRDEEEFYKNSFFPRVERGDESPSRYDRWDHIAQTFLDMLIRNEYRAIAWIMTMSDLWYGNAGPFAFIEDVVFTSGEIIYEAMFSFDGYEYHGKTYQILLSVKESESPLFPTGENIWELVIGDTGFETILRFELLFAPTRYEFNLRTTRGAGVRTSERACMVALSISLIGLHGLTDEDGRLLTVDSVYRFSHSSLPIPWEIVGDGWRWTYKACAAEFMRVVERYLGIKDFDFLYNRQEWDDSYDEEISTVVISFGQTFVVWEYASLLSSEFNEEDNTHRIVISFYADTASWVPAFTDEFIYNIHDDDSFTLLSLRRIYDSGFPALFGSN